jgi:hypothetical protein
MQDDTCAHVVAHAGWCSFFATFFFVANWIYRARIATEVVRMWVSNSRECREMRRVVSIDSILSPLLSMFSN